MTLVSPWQAAKDAPPAEPTVGSTDFAGRRWRLFRMTIGLGLLTVLTLGLYRFWMKTKLRRWYWSAFRPLGHPVEYVGDPWEKLLGFLIAVVFLAFYIGVVNLLLMFASFSLFNGNVAAYFLSFLGVIPLWFYARYRARRYVLARTRWQGIRFGLAPGAWGYARRALWHWFLTLITCGLLWPRKAFYLEKFITDRTFFGDQSLRQEGRWTGLLRPWLGVWLPLFALAVFLATLVYVDSQIVAPELFDDLFDEAAESAPFAQLFRTLLVALPIAFTVLPIWAALGVVNYHVKSLRYLTENKHLTEANLSIAPRFWRVTGIYFWGYLLASLVASLCLIPIIALIVVVAMSYGAGFEMEIGVLTDLPRIVAVVLAVAGYFTLFLMWSALTHTFVRFPLLRHYAETLKIHHPVALKEVRQRPRDEFGEAEGFAEALDVGAAI
ncbi:DUF898 family protein [Cognatishimia sp. SS12]|uniref:DUF898 family protein n=1 Tax=Cognatishimia sp. SS12 TaxID=2979465 RepID=UPI002330CBF9|nr:DUF898 family protein [Cognatishimia sp. SS12]MDC0738412.1 DUF898 family protein [Cognatishimia sp. SS12]